MGKILKKITILTCLSIIASFFVVCSSDDDDNSSSLNNQQTVNQQTINQINSSVTSGTWSVTDSNSNDDSPDDLHFNIAFSRPNQFADLSDDWDVVSQSSTKIELIDVSGGNGGQII